MEDMLYYLSKDCDKYKEGFVDGASKALYKVKGNVELYLEREEAYAENAAKLALGENEEALAEAKASAFTEVLSVIKELEETLSCM